METQKIETVRKVPILGDIPFLGIPFRHTVKEDRKRELLIFLTPFIVNDASGIARETEGEDRQECDERERGVDLHAEACTDPGAGLSNRRLGREGSLSYPPFASHLR